MTLTTPALLFPAISLLLLAYTNRFLALAQLLRALARDARAGEEGAARRQISLLQRRIRLIRHMQVAGVGSFLLCTLSMFALFLSLPKLGMALFGLSLLALAVSLLYSLAEVLLSTNALNVQLQALDEACR